jgi:50S ribosomal protein L16 3-hydroxylase
MKPSLEQKAIVELRHRCAGEPVNPVHFLTHFWQKRPLLVRGAFPSFVDPVSRDELAGLSCEADVESRLVMERGGKKPWQVIQGPQRVTQLQKLPPSHWTLLVQHVDRWVPGVAALLQPFRFIPDWRVDDVMISFAPRAGTVGPHLDSYDVFLLQGQGRRRWRLDSKAPAALRPGLDMRILKQFYADADWTLEPGDMLYLPPNLAHYGVALEECLTYSIGFRSPSVMELLALAEDRLQKAGASSWRYRDPGLRMPKHPGEISPETLRTLRTFLEEAIQGIGVPDFAAFAGALLTEPKGVLDSGSKRMSPSALQASLKRGASLVRSPGHRLAFIRQGKGAVLFVNGQSIDLNPSLAFAAPLLTGSPSLSFAQLAPHFSNVEFVRLLTQLLVLGAFYQNQ